MYSYISANIRCVQHITIMGQHRSVYAYAMHHLKTITSLLHKCIIVTSTFVFGDGCISTHADLRPHAARVARALTEL